MDENGRARLAPRSTTSLVAGNHLCDQVACLLGVEEATIRRAFLGEPVEVVLAMTEWVLFHEGEEGFYPETVLAARAERRGRGAWRYEDRRVEECRHCRGLYLSSGDESVREAACPVCRGAGIGLKPLRIRSRGERR